MTEKNQAPDTANDAFANGLERKGPAVVEQAKEARARARLDERAPDSKDVGVHEIARAQAERNTRDGRE